jgi:putative transposase
MPMPQPRGPQPTEICLTECQRAILEELVRRHQTPQVEVLRARIVLEAATGARNTHIAHTLGLDPKTVHLWWRRWAGAAERLRASEAEGGAQAVRQVICTLLADAPRSGCPATFTAEQPCQLRVLAGEAPEASGRPVTQWTPHELADEAGKRGIVESISPRTVGRFLKRGGLKAPSVSLLAQQ